MSLSGLSTHNLVCSRGYRELFANLCMDVQLGEILRVEGKNGSGKTSLLRILAGLAQPVSGEVLWQGVPIHSIESDYFQNLLYIGHKPGIKYELSAIENLCLSRALFGSRTENGIEEALNQVGLYGFEDIPTSMLSAGQKRRVALAQLFLTRATVWILDEPYTSLDVTAVTLLEELFRQHVQAGGLLIVTSHQALNIAGCVSKRLILPEINIEQVA